MSVVLRPEFVVMNAAILPSGAKPRVALECDIVLDWQAKLECNM